MESVPLWQIGSLVGILCWIWVSRLTNLTILLRSLTQPGVTRHVNAETPFILKIQGFQCPTLDVFFSALSCIVSVPFYTAFLPFLFWSGHSKLARQMTLLMAFCDYVGNALKDLISAPRPSSPPVRRVTATKDEKGNAQEYGLPSSHALNTVCLFGLLFSYTLSSHAGNPGLKLLALIMVCVLDGLIGLGRIYLGMHSPIDVLGGVVLGSAILAAWLSVHELIDTFIVSGQNVTSFWASLAFLLLFAYPTPELPTPSFEYHTAFNGVALGVVGGIQQTYLQFHHEDVPRILSEQLSIMVFIGRIMVGIPIILIVKFCSKALAKWLLPIICNALGIPIRSSCYIPALKKPVQYKTKCENKMFRYLQNTFFFSPEDSYDVDTGIRFLQYAGLAC
ncbi:lipid phosphate phosphatase delta isoform X2 [Amborella trichopoda]|uniref:lipid phosphate phosphatase delta isoform X2 n=1 Tax=Amborella trichopoda TaxID=13333 RepID=UPI0009BE07AC|nr:lipid phosphate phosphatase delta isoform X2 [Amborella trichopoda]|eukprot:XP_020521952.1 lipid phosphate phosphatase delta isoform X2 [Amborella trichopoda]